MTNYEEKTNNEILTQIKQMQADHEALKIKMLADYDKLLNIEQEFVKAHKVINERLNGKEE